MIFFLIIILVYPALLVLIKPAPASLKAPPLTYSENFKSVYASILTGVFISFVFLLISDFTFINVNENLYGLLALNNDFENVVIWPLQAISHLFIHADPLHLLANLSGLGLASVYERRVGARRYFSVLLVGALASIPSFFFYPGSVSVCGISGGVFGLAAAYFTDEERLNLKEWVGAILAFFALVLVFTLADELKSMTRQTGKAPTIQMDHIGHVLGALGAILYCRLRPGKIRGVSQGENPPAS